METGMESSGFLNQRQVIPLGKMQGLILYSASRRSVRESFLCRHMVQALISFVVSV